MKRWTMLATVVLTFMLAWKLFYQKQSQKTQSSLSTQHLPGSPAFTKATATALSSAKQDQPIAVQVLPVTQQDIPQFLETLGDLVPIGPHSGAVINNKELLTNYWVREEFIAELKIGQPIILTTPTYPKHKFGGIVNAISTTVDATTHSLQLQALVSNPQGILHPGMFVRIRQNIGVKQAVLVVPQEAIQSDTQGHYVFKVVNGHAWITPVRLGLRSQGLIEVIRGVELNDLVIVGCQRKIIHGMPVKF